ncbi:uncharacterized protein B0I36DRAFT_11451 [Microdochium trichocladiopsis]|uniref:Uncharacterized protein n=1 Tax=Microdochium trichocladiopsis TaxID=1682393 RepID=A0A9P8YI92_9PEZI|nr:uncharacterized protein B0I36DRAFT_11451 [Microdochium trichocladiopsis]KAH7040508.1 hypothetical protein B0I36DRAFT_11451 [Microdochium trichocladiopsis]
MKGLQMRNIDLARKKRPGTAGPPTIRRAILLCLTRRHSATIRWIETIINRQRAYRPPVEPGSASKAGNQAPSEALIFCVVPNLGTAYLHIMCPTAPEDQAIQDSRRLDRVALPSSVRHQHRVADRQPQRRCVYMYMICAFILSVTSVTLQRYSNIVISTRTYI